MVGNGKDKDGWKWGGSKPTVQLSRALRTSAVPWKDMIEWGKMPTLRENDRAVMRSVLKISSFSLFAIISGVFSTASS